MAAVIVLTVGATQSNPVRQTAAVAAKMGIDCHILLEDRTGYNKPNEPSDRMKGNVLLDVLHGATIEHRGPGLDMSVKMLAVAEKFHADGRKPYVIVGDGLIATGALGYLHNPIACLLLAQNCRG